ncbi:hypothetical protein GQ53DRAFT_793936 [Thozetella sp. PMI_491]|nr:hypothetical protein GQ53DRAFT_793936 [Thozetella sp. PMI_491]
MSQSPPPEATTAEYGPRRGTRPQLSRVRACAACKKHKIRCEVRRGESSCTKCIRSGIECVPHDFSQRFLNQDASWKAQAAAQIGQLQTAVNCLLQQNRLPTLSVFNTDGVSTSPSSGPTAHAVTPAPDATVVPMDMTRDNSAERQLEEQDLVPAPMSSLYELTKVRNLRSSALWRGQTSSIEKDFISRGIISAEEANFLFSRYMEAQHPLLWQVRRSTMLAAAVLTVAALHTPGRSKSLQICYETFTSLVCSSSLSRHQSLDDIRALALVAFYLSNLSWRLSGQAVRMAAEMNLHHSFQKLVAGDINQHERLRLWYALYVCDRHFSIAYGRPPATFDDVAIDGVERFIQSPAVLPGDIRLGAQVALFKILTEAYLEFGRDQQQALSEEDLDKLRRYNLSIEQWRLFWQPRSLDNAECGSYPSTGLVLYYHFARFQINSLALRAVTWPDSAAPTTPPSPSPLSLSRREAANVGISAAMNTLTHILDEPDLRKALPGVPIFTHTMVAFCATFLLKIVAILGKVNTRSLAADGPSSVQTLGIALDPRELLSDVAMRLGEKHLARHIVAGIREMLQRVAPQDSSVDFHKADGSRPVPNGEYGAQEGLGAGPQSGMYEPSSSADFENLIGLLEFGFDETFLYQQISEADFELWPATA